MIVKECDVYYLRPGMQRLKLCLSQSKTTYMIEWFIGPGAKIVTEYTGPILKAEKEIEFSSPAERL